MKKAVDWGRGDDEKQGRTENVECHVGFALLRERSCYGTD